MSKFSVTNQKLDNKGLLEKALSARFSKKIKIISRPGKKDKGLLMYAKLIQNILLKEISLIKILK